MLVGNEYMIEFLLGGNCECVIKNVDTGNSFTFKIRRMKDGENAFFIHVKESHSYVYAGVLSLKGSRFYFNTGKKGKLSEGDTSIKALLYVLNHANKLPPKVQVWHTGRCSRCGRKLEDPESIMRGMGPECFKKTQGVFEL